MTQYPNQYYLPMGQGNPMASDSTHQWSNFETGAQAPVLDPQLDPHLQLPPSSDLMGPGTPPWHTSSSYGLRPRISLTPHGKASQECQSLATARRNNNPPSQTQQQVSEPIYQEPHSDQHVGVERQMQNQPDAIMSAQSFETPTTSLNSLEVSLGGVVTMQDLDVMIINDTSKDLTPPESVSSHTTGFPHQTLSPDIVDTRCSESHKRKELLLEQFGFMPFGPPSLDPNDLFSPNSQVFASASNDSGTHLSTTDVNKTPNHSDGEGVSKRLFQDLPTTHSSGGRPTNQVRKILDQTFQDINELVRRAAEDTSRSTENILSLWHQAHALKRLRKSFWNKYQAYFAENSDEERERVGHSNASAKDCWPSFQEAFPEWQSILNTYEDLQALRGTSDSTIAQRTKDFRKLGDKLANIITDGSTHHGFEGFFVIVGNCVNEDAGLARVLVTAGAEDILEERLALNKDTLAAQLKVHVFNKLSLAHKEVILLERDRLKRDKLVEAPTSTSPCDRNEDKEPEDDQAQEALNSTVITARIRQSFIKTYAAKGVRLSDSQLPWSKLPKITAEHGFSISNWPDLVPFPGEKKKTVGHGAAKKVQGSIKCLNMSELTALWMAFQDTGTAPRLSKADPQAMLASKEPVFNGAPPASTSDHLQAKRFFVDGRMDRLGLPRLGPGPVVSKSARPLKSVKIENTSTLLSMSPLSPLETVYSPTPKRPSASTRLTKGKNKKIDTPDSDDDKPLISKKQKTSNKTIVLSDIDSDSLFVDDSEVDGEEIAPFTSTVRRSQAQQPTKRPQKSRYAPAASAVPSNSNSTHPVAPTPKPGPVAPMPKPLPTASITHPISTIGLAPACSVPFKPLAPLAPPAPVSSIHSMPPISSASSATRPATSVPSACLPPPATLLPLARPASSLLPPLHHIEGAQQTPAVPAAPPNPTGVLISSEVSSKPPSSIAPAKRSADVMAAGNVTEIVSKKTKTSEDVQPTTAPSTVTISDSLVRPNASRESSHDPSNVPPDYYRQHSNGPPIHHSYEGNTYPTHRETYGAYIPYAAHHASMPSGFREHGYLPPSAPSGSNNLNPNYHHDRYSHHPPPPSHYYNTPHHSHQGPGSDYYHPPPVNYGHRQPMLYPPPPPNAFHNPYPPAPPYHPDTGPPQRHEQPERNLDQGAPNMTNIQKSDE